jgi:hypothetical protein
MRHLSSGFSPTAPLIGKTCELAAHCTAMKVVASNDFCKNGLRSTCAVAFLLNDGLVLNYETWLCRCATPGRLSSLEHPETFQYHPVCDPAEILNNVSNASI